MQQTFPAQLHGPKTAGTESCQARTYGGVKRVRQCGKETLAEVFEMKVYGRPLADP
jgi:hypothetical protein